ncbi:MAG: serine hydrolase domain-containing protein, partial [bacterium]|nr:serine hydrolase domain-containing protein [bacterium]
KLDLDEPLVTYIPEFTMADPRYVDITPRMLLNHTSGLMGTTTHDSFTFGKSDTRYHDSILEELSSQSLKADPGAYGVYCNDGFTLAELLIERVSGMGYSEYLEQYFFKPMGIRNTFTPVYGFQEERLAATYLGDSELPYIDCHLIGSGGIYSTASDVAQFGQLFAGRNEGILSEQTLAEMAESNSSKDTICRVDGDKQFDYGLGWDCVDTYPYSAYGIRALSKGGSILFQNSALVVLPEEGISASMIVSGGSGDDATYAIQDLILEILQEEGIIDEKKDLEVQVQETPPTKQLPEEMREFAGYYLSNQMMQVSFSKEGTMLLENLEDEYAVTQEYAYIGEGAFVPLNGAYLSHTGKLTCNSDGNLGYGTIRFLNEKNGQTYMTGSAYESLYGLGENATSIAFAQKVEEGTVSAAELEKWEKRDGRLYFLTDSVYNSWNYYTEGVVELQCNRELAGYIHTDKKTDTAVVKDGDNAVSEVELPIMTGRDLAVYECSASDGDGTGERLKLSTLTYLSEDQVSSIAELAQEVTMTRSEETMWYRVDPEYANQTVKIVAPKEGAYYLYNEKRDCMASSIMLTDGTEVLLPKGGYLVLAGEAGQTFQIHGEWMK